MKNRGIINKNNGRFEVHSLYPDGKTAFIIRFDELKADKKIQAELNLSLPSPLVGEANPFSPSPLVAYGSEPTAQRGEGKGEGD